MPLNHDRALYILPISHVLSTMRNCCLSLLALAVAALQMRVHVVLPHERLLSGQSTEATYERKPNTLDPKIWVSA